MTYIKDSDTANNIIARATTEGISKESINIDNNDLDTIILTIQISKAIIKLS